MRLLTYWTNALFIPRSWPYLLSGRMQTYLVERTHFSSNGGEALSITLCAQRKQSCSETMCAVRLIRRVLWNVLQTINTLLPGLLRFGCNANVSYSPSACVRPLGGTAQPSCLRAEMYILKQAGRYINNYANTEENLIRSFQLLFSAGASRICVQAITASLK